MELILATYTDQDGLLLEINHPGKLEIWKRKESQWLCEGSMAVDLSLINSLPALRQKMEEVAEFLSGTRALMVRQIAGVPFFAMEKAGISIWEWEGRVPAVLAEVEEEVQAALAESRNSCGGKNGNHGNGQETEGKKSEDLHLLAPREESPGHFYISLLEIQGKEGLTSKQVLLPFLRSGKFSTLEILCSHLPPWLELFVQGSPLKMEILEEKPRSAKVKIQK